MKALKWTLPALLACTLGAAEAQLPKIPGVGGLPNVSSMGVGNAAGVLGYCVKNKLVGGDASSVLGSLTKKPGVTSSKDYAAGQSGLIQTKGSSLSLSGVQDKLKTQACDMVLKQAKTFI